MTISKPLPLEWKTTKVSGWGLVVHATATINRKRHIFKLYKPKSSKQYVAIVRVGNESQHVLNILNGEIKKWRSPERGVAELTKLYHNLTSPDKKWNSGCFVV